MIPLAFFLPAFQAGAPAQVSQQESFATVELRVVSVRPRQAVVDRGLVDGLIPKDRVTFRPRDGRVFGGTVVEVGERESVVELDDAAIVVVPGTKGEVRVPISRLPKPPVPEPAEEVEATPPAAPQGEAPPAVPEHPPWTRPEDEWRSSEPLLARIRPFRPEEREPHLSGRAYTLFDYLHSSEGPRSDTFARSGTSLLLENPFSLGGELRMDAELNYRATDVPDADDEEKTRLRIDRLSWARGGNRFAPDRVEFGRFLQHDVPELGVIDGGQWSRRLSGGDSFGGSLGFIPSPDVERDSGSDLQIAGYYRWVADESEQLSLTGGLQKTFHHLDADRDLFVGKIVYLPVSGWDLTGTAWVDLYTSGDEAKGAGLGLTQAYLSTGKRWDSGSSVRMTYAHLEFPENELDAFTPVLFDQLADDHLDRVSASPRLALGRHFGIFARGGLWTDEDDEGGDGELGFDIGDIAAAGTRLEMAGFYTGGRFSQTFVGRAGVGGSGAAASWNVLYEFAYDDIRGFDADNNSLPHHRARASVDLNTASRWSLSFHVEALLFDEETSVLAGFFLQRSF